jgi:hypothetical protein
MKNTTKWNLQDRLRNGEPITAKEAKKLTFESVYEVVYPSTVEVNDVDDFLADVLEVSEVDSFINDVLGDKGV